MLCNLVLKRQTLRTQAKAIKSKFLKISDRFLIFLLILLIKDGFLTDLLINRLLLLILSFYLMYYDFLLYIFLYFCVVNTAIFFHFKFFIFQCSVRGQEKGRCGGSGFIWNITIWYNSHDGLISIDRACRQLSGAARAYIPLSNSPATLC